MLKFIVLCYNCYGDVVKKCSILIVYFAIFLFLEGLFKILMFDNFFSLNLINIILFISFLTVVFGCLNSMFKEKYMKLILLINTFISCAYFAFQFCLFNVYKIYFSLELSSGVEQVLDFKDEIFSVIIHNVLYLILFFVPFILLIIFRKKLILDRFGKKEVLISFLTSILIFVIFSLSLIINKDNSYSAYKLYYEYNEMELAVERLGLSNSFYLDVIKTVIGFEEKLEINTGSSLKDLTANEDDEKDEEEEIIYGYNTLDLDLTFEGTKNTDLMNEYFLNEQGTLKNEYSSYFEGKNIIMVMAESFHEVAVDEKRTPTLYKLINEGFNFENFYSPTINSTIGGEFQMLTGLYPASGYLSPYKSGDTEYLYGLASSFESIGYNTFAYHNNTYTFQNRYKYLEDMGFDNFKACNNGMEDLIDCKWLASDLDMFDKTFDEYASMDEPFLTYYATVSGHGSYYLTGEFSKKYLDTVEGDYSDGIKAYLAAQVELDRALELLIQKLSDKGILEDTVIVLASDHYPYMLSVDEINEASDYVRDEVIEIDHNTFIIWNSQMEAVTIDKVGSQIDILPTVYNLFGVPYDSRLIVGKDILSSEPGLAIFNNRSWVSDYGYYYASTNEFVLKEGKIVSEEYVSSVNQIVNSKINISGLLITENYYKYLK